MILLANVNYTTTNFELQKSTNLIIKLPQTLNLKAPSQTQSWNNET